VPDGRPGYDMTGGKEMSPLRGFEKKYNIGSNFIAGAENII
jgi:hypothetical protein